MVRMATKNITDPRHHYPVVHDRTPHHSGRSTPIRHAVEHGRHSSGPGQGAVQRNAYRHVLQRFVERTASLWAGLYGPRRIYHQRQYMAGSHIHGAVRTWNGTGHARYRVDGISPASSNAADITENVSRPTHHHVDSTDYQRFGSRYSLPEPHVEHKQLGTSPLQIVLI